MQKLFKDTSEDEKMTFIEARLSEPGAIDDIISAFEPAEYAKAYITGEYDKRMNEFSWRVEVMDSKLEVVLAGGSGLATSGSSEGCLLEGVCAALDWAEQNKQRVILQFLDPRMVNTLRSYMLDWTRDGLGRNYDLWCRILPRQHLFALICGALGKNPSRTAVTVLVKGPRGTVLEMPAPEVFSTWNPPKSVTRGSKAEYLAS